MVSGHATVTVHMHKQGDRTGFVIMTKVLLINKLLFVMWCLENWWDLLYVLYPPILCVYFNTPLDKICFVTKVTFPVRAVGYIFVSLIL